jgi:hypothetical protein
MSNKYKFICETYTEVLWQKEPCVTGTVTHEIETDSLDELVEAFQHFVRGCGFSGGTVVDWESECDECRATEERPDRGAGDGPERGEAADNEGVVGRGCVCEDENGFKHSTKSTSTWADGVVSTRAVQS